MQNSVEQNPTHDDIAVAAYCAWEHEGRPAGRDVEFWLQAEQLLVAAVPAAPAATTTQAQVAVVENPASIADERSKTNGKFATNGSTTRSRTPKSGRAKPAASSAARRSLSKTILSTN